MLADTPIGPVITPELLENLVKSVDYHMVDGSNTILCTLKLTNGFTITGQAHCLPTTKFDPAMGHMIAREDANERLAQFAGFLAYDILAGGPAWDEIEAAIELLKGGL